MVKQPGCTELALAMLMRDDATPIQPSQVQSIKVGGRRVSLFCAPRSMKEKSIVGRGALKEKRGSFDTGSSNSGCGLRIGIERE